MTLTTTLLLMLASLIVAAGCHWHQRRERPLGEISMFPSTIVMALAVMLLVLATAHLVSLLTGVPLKGRMGF